MDYRHILGLISAGIQLYAFIPYMIGIFRGTFKPHVFTWLLWGMLASIAFVAQLVEKAGAGSWITGVNTMACLLTAVLALKYGTRNITRSDWICLLCGLLAIPVWLATHNPLWAVLIVCTIDTIAFWPTFRKTWHQPHEDSIQAFGLGGIASLISIFALHNVSLATFIYPFCLFALNFAFVVMVLYRRHVSR